MESHIISKHEPKFVKLLFNHEIISFCKNTNTTSQTQTQHHKHKHNITNTSTTSQTQAQHHKAEASFHGRMELKVAEMFKNGVSFSCVNELLDLFGFINFIHV